MRKNYTTDGVLIMLQEIKGLSDINQFSTKEFLIEHPSFYTFRKHLYQKGLIKKIFGKEKWISIEPNRIMASEILKIYKSHQNELKEARLDKLKIIKESQESIQKELPIEYLNDSFVLSKKEELESLQERHDLLIQENNKLNNECADLKFSLHNNQQFVADYERQLKKAEKEFALSKNKAIANCKEEIKYLKEKLNKKLNSRKFRFLGITIFSIEN